MLNVTVLCVGRLKERYWEDACEEYRRRLSGSCRITVIEVAEERLPDKPSAAQIEAAMEEEGRRLLAKLPSGGAVAAMCIEGKMLNSEEFAARLDHLALDGVGQITFLIGGPNGLSEQVKRAASWRLSMSPMTFPHRLARVMLLEQLYRASQILGGGKYHR